MKEQFSLPRARRCSIRGRPSLLPIHTPPIIYCAKPSPCTTCRSAYTSRAVTPTSPRSFATSASARTLSVA